VLSSPRCLEPVVSWPPFRPRALYPVICDNAARCMIVFSRHRYQFVHCSAEAGRGRVDWRNAAVAGLVTGGLLGTPVALRAGEPKLALMAAGLTAGTFCPAPSGRSHVR
jgi:hypothetical protein